MGELTHFDLHPAPLGWGIRIPGQKDHARQGPILVAPPPQRVTLSLHQNIGAPSEPLVRIGQQVLRGEPVAAPTRGQLTAAVHASISGTVVAIEPRPVPVDGEALCVIIEHDGSDAPWPGYPAFDDPAHLRAVAIRSGVREAGIVGLGGAQFPTDAKLNKGLGIDALLLNGAECEPWISCDDALLCERAIDVLRGAQIMMHAVETRSCIIAIKNTMDAAEAALRESLATLDDDRIDIAVVPDRYPAGGERQLIQWILEREVPAGGLPWDVGVVCHNVATAAAVAARYYRGEPVISRIITVTGDGVRAPVNIEARIGTPVRDLISLAGGYTDAADSLIMGGPMMGLALPDDSLPITKATNCLLVTEPGGLAEPPVQRPCIRCGDCARVCPARLMPQDLLALARHAEAESLEKRGIVECIECGACDYVCPSGIPLTGTLRMAKQQVWRRNQADRLAVQARRRYEAREQRLAHAANNEHARLTRQIEAVGSPDNPDPQALEAVMQRVRARQVTTPDDEPESS